MAQISSQTPLTTVRNIIETGPAGRIGVLAATNYSGSAVIIKVYLVPSNRPSSTITDHILWVNSCAANATSVLDLNQYNIYLGDGRFRLEAEAASSSAVTLTVLGS